jgi:hypothetical protein
MPCAEIGTHRLIGDESRKERSLGQEERLGDVRYLRHLMYLMQSESRMLRMDVRKFGLRRSGHFAVHVRIRALKSEVWVCGPGVSAVCACSLRIGADVSKRHMHKLREVQSWSGTEGVLRLVGEEGTSLYLGTFPDLRWRMSLMFMRGRSQPTCSAPASNWMYVSTLSRSPPTGGRR